jgi:hypothetical protein
MDDKTCPPEPSVDESTSPVSSGSLYVLSGTPITLWQTPLPGELTDTLGELRLEPDRPAVIGRQEGRDLEYLDPAYRPTQVLPATGRSVLRGRQEDIFVSRGHFMLRAMAGGILFVNGVPRRGGGIRPPLNGTWLVDPESRPLGPAEEYPIERGEAVVIRLPNGSLIRIDAR